MSHQTQNARPTQPPTSIITPLAAPAGAAAPGSAELPTLLDQPFSAFGSINQFKDAQRMATLLAHSSIVPETYRGDEHIGDCVLALEIANRIGASVLAVMQNLYLVEGKPGWSSQFLISCVNATKRFSPIRYRMTGTQGEDNWGCIAWAIDKTGEALQSPEVTIHMAKEEGWYYRNGGKWKTMPELMLCYRSATLFTRLYAPEIAMGIQTTDELVEIAPEGNKAPCRPIFEPWPNGPTSEPSSQVQPNHDATVNRSLSSNSAVPKTDQAPAAKSAPSLALVTPAPTNGQNGHYNHLKALTGLIHLSNHSDAEVLLFLHKSRKCDESLASLAKVADQQPSAIVWTHDNWESVDREITRLKQNQVL